MPAEHLGLLFLRVANRIHPELAQHERLFLGQVLQAKEIFFEVALVVQVDIEAAEIDVLRQEVFRRRIAGVGEEDIRVRLASDADQRLEKFGHAPHPEPAHHGGWDFVADEVTEDGGMAGVGRHRLAHGIDNLAPGFRPNEKLDVLRPRQGDQDPDAGFGAAVEKPARRQVVDARDIDPELAHLGEVAPGLLRIAEVIARGIRPERPVGGALDEKLAVALEEKLGESSDANGRSLTHEEPFLVQGDDGRKAFARDEPNG